MVSSPKSPHDEVIRDTVDRYQKCFSSGDREGWLALFADDGSMEDPVGSPARKGRAELSAFWDEVHQTASSGTIRAVSGPNVCGLEAAWAFELLIPAGDKTIVVSILDHGVFDDAGHIRQIRAFWNEGTIGVRPAD